MSNIGEHRAARARCIPIVMVTSGGYQRSTARVIADSILNLRAKHLISNDDTGDVMASVTGAGDGHR